MSDGRSVSLSVLPPPVEGGRSRVLFLSPVVPAPLDRGQNVRIHHLISGLAQAFRVTLVLPEAPGPDRESPLWAAVDEVVAAPPAAARPGVGDVLRFLLRHRTVMRPAVVARLLPFRQALDRLPLDEYDAIWVERMGLVRLVAKARSRVVVDLDDLEHRGWLRELRLHARDGVGRDLLRRLFNAGQSSVRELLLARRYGRCAVSSAADAGYLRRWRMGNGALLPHGAVADNRGGPDLPGSSRRLVFLGNLGYGPNVDALEYFEESVRPELDELGVPVDLTVMGPGVTDELVARFPRVEFRGFVADLPEALRSFDVSVVPLRLGGGTKLKVLDAMAAGLPVVTTTVGAEGLAVDDGLHLFVADGPRAFAAAVACLLGDDALARTLGKRGRRLVEEQYSWRSVQDRAVELVAGVVARRRRSAPVAP
jgi:polysaccharide biosynthesis protein PslH